MRFARNSYALKSIKHSSVQGLVEGFSDNNLLQYFQYGFTSGRSTVTTMLHFDAVIANVVSSNHAYDVIALDLKSEIWRQLYVYNFLDDFA